MLRHIFVSQIDLFRYDTKSISHDFLKGNIFEFFHILNDKLSFFCYVLLKTDPSGG